jgi:hypothetical protein
MKKTLAILFIILSLNAVRYLTYILEENDSVYYVGMFLVNLIAIMGVIIHFYSQKNIHSTNEH